MLGLYFLAQAYWPKDALKMLLFKLSLGFSSVRTKHFILSFRFWGPVKIILIFYRKNKFQILSVSINYMAAAGTQDLRTHYLWLRPVPEAPTGIRSLVIF
jgi:hypothetical protein